MAGFVRYLCWAPVLRFSISAHYPERWIADAINSVLAPDVAYFAKIRINALSALGWDIVALGR